MTMMMIIIGWQHVLLWLKCNSTDVIGAFNCQLFSSALSAKYSPHVSLSLRANLNPIDFTDCQLCWAQVRLTTGPLGLPGVGGGS